jgi:hypothetical protein
LPNGLLRRPQVENPLTKSPITLTMRDRKEGGARARSRAASWTEGDVREPQVCGARIPTAAGMRDALQGHDARAT